MQFLALHEFRESLDYHRATRCSCNWNLTSAYSDIDIVIRPRGFNGGYADMVGRSKVIQSLASGSTSSVISFPVADVYDIYLSKRNTGRFKDKAHLKAFREVVKQHHKNKTPPFPD